MSTERPAPDVAIRTHALTKRYGALEAVRGIDLDVRAGEIFGLIGPDGAGKTSTFQILGGVMEATSGTAELLGQPARQARAYVGYLTQAFSLYQDLSVAENLRYVGELRQSLGLQRLEVRATDLRQAEATLIGRDGIADVQRFGDRLDVLVREAESGERAVREALGEAVASVRTASPTLENTFVAILRSLEGETRVPPFPDRRDHEPAGDPVAIGARGLRRTFGEFVAVKGIDLEVRYGEVYGLLGANGAGKTTTIKMLCGLLEPSSGEVRLAGEIGELRSEAVRQQVGYMSQKFSLYDDLTIDENLDFFAGVYQVPRERREARKRWVLEFAGLPGKGGQLTGSLPGGWKQRVAFGAAIMHEPRVLFLDEPTSGVDPIARRAFWAMINQLADQGTAILVTTHYLEEAEQCNRLGFMVAGELVAEGTPSGVKAAHGGRVLEVLADDPQRAVAVLKTELEPWRVSLFGDRLHVIVEGDAQAAARDLAARLAREGIQVREAREEDYSLEDVFLVIAEKGVVAA